MAVNGAEIEREDDKEGYFSKSSNGEKSFTAGGNENLGRQYRLAPPPRSPALSPLVHTLRRCWATMHLCVHAHICTLRKHALHISKLLGPGLRTT